MQQLILKTLILTILFNSFAFAQIDKADFYSKIKTKFNGLKTLYVKFESNSGLKGNIKVKRVGKFVMNMGDNMIYCNGKTTWNMNIPQRRVTIDNVIKGSANSIMEELFFNVISNSNPTNLTKQNGSKYYLLELDIDKDASKKIPNISNLKVMADANGNITKISFKQAGKTEEIKITEMNFNPKFKDSVFDLTPPQGFQVIELR